MIQKRSNQNLERVDAVYPSGQLQIRVTPEQGARFELSDRLLASWRLMRGRVSGACRIGVSIFINQPTD